MDAAKRAFQDIGEYAHEGLHPDSDSEDGLTVSEEVYWEKYYGHLDFNYEWNNGILEEKPVSDFLNVTAYQWFVDILRCYFSIRPIGKLVNMEMGFRLALPNKTSIRKPDLAVILNRNPADLDPEDLTFTGIFDFCVELLSDASRKGIERDTVAKKDEYEQVGVGEYFIIDAREREMAFYRRNTMGIFDHIPPVSGDIIQSAVLPGFRFRISDLNRQPSLQDMAVDPVYRDYVLPFYRREKERADREKERADKLDEALVLEKQRADMERKRAEELERRLEAMGISLNHE